MSKIITTISDLCHECYACVRNCPAKALRVRDRQAEVIEERCIQCGNCVRICAQGAKKVKDYLPSVRKLLKSKNPVAAALAPSFPSYDPNFDLLHWKNYLKGIGFSRVYEVAWGAQLIVEEYKKLLDRKEETVISSACPVIVNLIENYYPELVDYLAPILSPMQALVRYIREVEKSDIPIVIIGPCLAKKGEFSGQDDVIVLTFSEVKELEQNIEWSNFSRTYNTEKGNSPTDSARRLPLKGGLLEAVTKDKDNMTYDYLKVEGSERVFDILNGLKEKEVSPGFVDILFCEGCINGVDLSHENFFKKEKAVYSFISADKEENTGVHYDFQKGKQVNLDRKFESDYKSLPQPTEEEIWNILNKTDKYDEDDLLDCGACGYDSCREKAIAVYQGLAEVEMCLPYLLNEKRNEIKEIQGLNRQMDTLINSSYDGMLLVDKDGKIEKVNKAYLDLIGHTADEVIGKRVQWLEEKRIIFPSVSALCYSEEREITLIQNTSDGRRLLTTGSPVFDNDNKLLRIVINSRDLSKLSQLEGNQKESKKLIKYLNEDNESDFNSPGHIISQSRAMKSILELSRRVGDTSSSVLLMGESGVGKEVIARYIHEQSSRKRLVKINCAAIPESLLESELFGYETGAFSGAKREGKEGLIEKADGGTLFLDEIGEMPLNMQAKLLQVLQEYRVTRIGGVDPIEVDFRLISATNQDLKKQVYKQEFREDLFYRLNVVPITIPPLRERKEDILALVDYYIGNLSQQYGRKLKLTKEARDMLLEYKWPGNVREISNLLERIVITHDNEVIDTQTIHEFIDFENTFSEQKVEINDLIPIQQAVGLVEKKLLKLARDKADTTYDMAELLGVNQSTVVRKLKKYFK
ncbi:MAG: sigma 54-interacting transcriptional regulator [Halanaerobiales bacterium]